MLEFGVIIMYLNCIPINKMKDDEEETSGFKIYLYFDEVKKGYCSHVRKAYDFLRPILCLDLRGFMSLECGFEEYEDGLKEMLDNMYFVNGVGDDCARQTFCSRHTRLVFVCWECGTVGFCKFISELTHKRYFDDDEIPAFKLSSRLLALDDISTLKDFMMRVFGENSKEMYVIRGLVKGRWGFNSLGKDKGDKVVWVIR